MLCIKAIGLFYSQFQLKLVNIKCLRFVLMEFHNTNKKKHALFFMLVNFVPVQEVLGIYFFHKMIYVESIFLTVSN